MSIGIIDTVGFVGSVNALDTCLKTADVEFVRFEKMSGGIVSIVIKGDVAAVSASIAAGVAAAKLLGEYRRHTIIARLDDQIQEMLSKIAFSKNKEVLIAAALKAEKMPNKASEFCSETEKINDNEPALNSLVDNKVCNYSEETLNAMTVSRLRKLAREMNLKGISRERIKRSRKVDLIANILKEEEE